MPEPNKGEKKQDYINRCVKYLIEKEGKKPDQARAQCEGMWNQHQKNKRKNKSENQNMIQSIISEPAWFMEPEALQNFMTRVYANLELKEENINPEFFGLFESEEGSEEKPYKIENGNAVIKIIGPLVKNASGFFARFFGIKGMNQISEEFSKAMKDSDCKGIFLQIDSPGGSADGTSDLSDVIFEARGKKPVLAFADGQMTSAAQWIGSSSDFVAIANETTRMGSVGVYGVHFDYSERAKELGIKPTVFTAGKYKGIGNQFEHLKKEDKKYIQDQFDYLHEQFIKAVSRNSSIPVEKLNPDLKEAKVFMGSQAIAVGLGHKIMNRNQAMELLSNVADGKVTFDSNKEKIKSFFVQGGEKRMDIEKMQTQITDLTSKLEAAQSLISEMKTSNQTAEITAERDSLKLKVSEFETKIQELESEIVSLKQKASDGEIFISAGKAHIENMKADIKKISAQVDGDAYNEELVNKQLAAFGNDIETLTSFKTSLETRRSKMIKTGDLNADVPKDTSHTAKTDQEEYELGGKIVPLHMRVKK